MTIYRYLIVWGIVCKVINFPVANLLGTKFYTNLRRQMPYLPLTMVGLALDGSMPIQPTIHPLSGPCNTIGIEWNSQKQQQTPIHPKPHFWKLFPDPVQIATQLPVQKLDQQVSPNKPTMMTPHTTPESYRNYKKIKYPASNKN